MAFTVTPVIRGFSIGNQSITIQPRPGGEIGIGAFGGVSFDASLAVTGISGNPLYVQNITGTTNGQHNGTNKGLIYLPGAPVANKNWNLVPKDTNINFTF